MNNKEKQEYCFNRLKGYVVKKGGKCLSEEYINNHTKLKFQCGEGHIWESSTSNIILNGCWCSKCKREEKQEYYFNRLKKVVAEKGGKCLSNNYVNNYTKLKFQCNKGHIWEATSINIINLGHWCRICYFDRQKNNINDIIKFVEGKGGKLLSKEYINCRTKLKFQCDKGHIWKTRPGNVVNDGTWCPDCYFNSQKNNINDVIKLVEQKGGKLLSKKYKNDKQKLEIECSKGHIWEVSYSKLKNGHWCSICSGLNRRLTYEERLKGFNFILNIAKEKGGKCLSKIKDYKNITSKLKFECIKGHEWEAISSRIKYNHWCLICGIERQRNSINDVIKLVEQKGGELLSKEYKNNKQKLEVDCGKGHIWEVNYNSLKNGSWCPDCKQSLSEKIFRIVMEKVFNCPFKSCWPKWLKNQNGHKLQIDGYNEELKIGFEYQGIQHFINTLYFHRTEEGFERRKSNDLAKKKILKNKNIFMLYPIYKLKKENYLSFIYSKIKNTKYEKLVNFNQDININELYKLL